MNDTSLPPPPSGVKLRLPEDYASLRKDIDEGVMDEMSRVFPQSYGGLTLSLHDPHYADDSPVSFADHKKAILNGGSLVRRLRGTLRLTDDSTGQVLDERTQTLARVPTLTDRGVFVDNGSNYSVAGQHRLLPGIYTRRKQNGGLETQFNTRVGSGPGFKVSFDPESALYYLEKKGSRLRLYPLLKDLGVDDKTLEEAWGTQILDKNRAKYDSRVFEKALKIFARKTPAEASREEKAKALLGAIDALQVNRNAVMSTLPNLFDRAKAASWTSADSGEDVLHKIARKMIHGGHGSCVLFWLGKGYYLLEENTEEPDIGKLRPAGGGRNPEDSDLRETILREIEEEFGISPNLVRPFLRLVGYQKAGKYKDSAVFVMWAHGLRPGLYHASNDPKEKVKLVKARLDDPRYIGPIPDVDTYLPTDATVE